MGSSQTWNRTYIPCIVKWFLKYWTTREAHVDFIMLSFRSIFWKLTPYQICDIKTFSFIWWFTFLLLSVVSFDAQNFAIFPKSNLYFIFLTFAIVITSKKLSKLTPWSFCLMFSSKSLLFLDLACESLIHFKLLFVKYVRVKSIILHVTIQFLKHHLF